jgi:CheY-like chemotaxis protein
MNKPKLDKFTALIVEDDKEIRDLVIEVLTDLKVFSSVTPAIDGSEAVLKMRNQSFDLIITDLNMPKMNGIDFIKNILADSKRQGTQIVVMSGEVTGPRVGELLRLGLRHIITKPTSVRSLVSKVSEVLKLDIKA